jgi:class 3 adenylate cyclase/CheY-like chemotaxis protein
MASPRRDPDLERRMRLVVWQDLVNPVRAIVGYQEIILEEAQRLNLVDDRAYLKTVLATAWSLSELVDRLRGADSTPADDLRRMQTTLRHDIRTALNAIIGYSEIFLEDLDGTGAVAPIAEVERLLVEARQLLNRIDAIVDLTRAARGPTVGESLGGHCSTAVAAGLLRTLLPKPDPTSRREVGRILVVDDNESNRDLLRRRLVLEGHEVIVAESGRRGLAMLEEQPVDLILLDLLMPDMNGIEVLERLKRDERWHEIPVIMISGLQESDAAIRCIEAGAEDYLSKPFNLVLLRARISACLERKRWREREQGYLARLREEKERSDGLIRNILPEAVVLRLNGGETDIADRFDTASILFADIVGFTPAAAAMTPGGLVARLDRVFSEFDGLAVRIGVEKIKTIGDAYMAAAGIPEPRADHAGAIVEFAVGLLDIMAQIDEGEQPLRLRIGIHSGPVVAGIIGRHKFIYDVWGDTVNVASRLESQGLPNRIQVSKPVRDAVAPRYAFERRGSISLKGRGRTPTYLLVHKNLDIR